MIYLCLTGLVLLLSPVCVLAVCVCAYVHVGIEPECEYYVRAIMDGTDYTTLTTLCS